MIEKCDLPKDFQWVDIENHDFHKALDEVLNGDGNLFIQAKAGCGKSLIIKIAAALKQNLVVLSTTGTTAIQLSSEGIPARTIHSFFQFRPSSIIDAADVKKWWGETVKVAQKTETLIIDEVSMLNAQMFDAIITKLKMHREDGSLPRLILFGDVLQLPPVIEKGLVTTFFNNTYGGKVMFFSSTSFQYLDFQIMTLNQSYRQVDEEFADNIYSVGLGSIDQAVLDYFNSRMMSLPKFEETHDKYIYMATTNSLVNKINKTYIDNLFSDKWFTYEARKSENFPPKLIEDEIMIKQGAQVMITRNNYAAGYTNGMVGKCVDLDENNVVVETETGKIVTVGRSHYEISKPYLDENKRIKFKVDSWAEQIDCKVCRAMTVHKSQGKTFDNAYLAPVGWTPPGIIYVGLSRLTSLNGLGISRPLTMEDVKVNQEAMDFLLKNLH